MKTWIKFYICIPYYGCFWHLYLTRDSGDTGAQSSRCPIVSMMKGVDTNTKVQRTQLGIESARLEVSLLANLPKVRAAKKRS